MDANVLQQCSQQHDSMHWHSWMLTSKFRPCHCLSGSPCDRQVSIANRKQQHIAKPSHQQHEGMHAMPHSCKKANMNAVMGSAGRQSWTPLLPSLGLLWGTGLLPCTPTCPCCGAPSSQLLVPLQPQVPCLTSKLPRCTADPCTMPMMQCLYCSTVEVIPQQPAILVNQYLSTNIGCFA